MGRRLRRGRRRREEDDDNQSKSYACVARAVAHRAASLSARSALARLPAVWNRVEEREKVGALAHLRDREHVACLIIY